MKEVLHLEDKIYGSFEIDSSFLIDLINSQPVQRLKRINQFGIPDKYYHYKNFSRYEHSVGVMLLLRHMGATEEEQAAGLIHDVSHMAFSHTYDWVMEDHLDSHVAEDAQDKGHSQFILNSDIPAIAKRNGYDVHQLIDYHRFGLLEREIPDLCADRVDYCLRETSSLRARMILSGLTSKEGQIICHNEDSAHYFARLFLDRQRNHWGGVEAVSRYYHFARALKAALDNKEISLEDFFFDDNYLLSKVEQSDHHEVKRRFKILAKSPIMIHKGSEVVVVHKKFRYVDPLFLKDEELVRLSLASDSFRNLLEEAKTENERGIPVEK